MKRIKKQGKNKERWRKRQTKMKEKEPKNTNL